MRPAPDILQNALKREREEKNCGGQKEIREGWDILLNSLTGRDWRVPRVVRSHLISQGRILVLVEWETTPLLKRIFILRIFFDEREKKVETNS